MARSYDYPGNAKASAVITFFWVRLLFRIAPPRSRGDKSENQGTMSINTRSRNRTVMLAAAGLGWLMLSCTQTDKDLGEGPIGPGAGTGLDTSSWVRDSVSGNMRIFATPQILKAGNKARATINVQVFDA